MGKFAISCARIGRIGELLGVDQAQSARGPNMSGNGAHRNQPGRVAREIIRLGSKRVCCKARNPGAHSAAAVVREQLLSPPPHGFLEIVAASNLLPYDYA